MDYAIRLILVILALGVSVIVHEMAHAWSALKLGDPTGRDDNRLSWNPIYHIDPFMTILLPLFLYISTNGAFVFGGAKPVRVNPLNFRNPVRGMMLSSAAGPLSNFLLAAVSTLLLLLLTWIWPGLIFGGDGDAIQLTYTGFLLFFMILINTLLGTFNLIPIPPLDGSRILYYFMPQGGRRLFDRIERFGLLILMILLIAGGFDLIIGPMYVGWALAMIELFGKELVGAFIETLYG